jgi:hypothetical protein
MGEDVDSPPNCAVTTVPRISVLEKSALQYACFLVESKSEARGWALRTERDSQTGLAPKESQITLRES